MGRVARLVSAAVILAAGSLAGNVTLASARPLTTVTVAMGFNPDVQFAPFYVAQFKGYYRREGLDVHFRYGIEPDLLRLASAGKVDFVNSGGDEVLAAGAHGMRVRYVLTQYSRFPVALFSLRRSGIRRPTDLVGKTIGIPGAYGASYVGLLAFLSVHHIPLSRVSLKVIGFTQAPAVAHGTVDAGVGYAMNEPVQLRAQGYTVDEMDLYRASDLAGAGIAAGDAEITAHPGTVASFVRATVAGMRDTLRDPNMAFRYAEQAVPEIRARSRVERAVLQRALNFWHPAAGRPVGWVDPAVWRLTARLLARFHQVPGPVDSSRFYTDRFIPGS